MWKHEAIVLSCGCSCAFRWDDCYVGLEVYCPEHGDVVVEVMHRVYEATPSKDFQLGVGDE